MKSAKGKKGALLTLLVSALCTLALLIAGVVFLGKVPQNAVIAGTEGSTVMRTARSYTDDSWYFADSAGWLFKRNDAGEDLARLEISSGKKILSVVSDPNLDCLLVLDEDFGFWRVTDSGTSLEKEFIKTFPGGYITATADEDCVYFAVEASRYTQFVKYAKDDLAGEPLARGEMYTCYKQGNDYCFEPVISGTITLFENDGESLYVVTGEGQYHKFSKDFALNSFSFLTQEELDALGATMENSGFVTLPGESYDSSKYRTLRSQTVANGAAFDRETKTLYVASAAGEFVAMDENFRTDKDKTFKLAGTPAKGGMTLHPESGTAYVAYDTLSAVTAVNVETNRVLYQANTAFYISSMTVTESGNRLLVVCSGNDRDNPDYKELLSVDIQLQGRRDLNHSLGTAFLVVGALLAVVCVFAALCAFKSDFQSRFTVTVRGMLRNWVVYLIVFGSLALLILFCYYPGISSMVLSFFDYTRDNPTMRFNNFENYIDIFTDAANVLAFRNMLIFLLSDIVIALVPPMVFAFCLSFMRNKKYSTFARIVLFLPTVLPGIATLLIWTQGIYGVDGVLNLLLRTVTGNADKTVLFLEDYGILSLIFMGFPFVGSYLIFYGALMNVPSSYYEAAELDGCSVFKRIFRIDIPMISPQIKYVFILAFIQSVQNFGRVLITTGGQFGTQIPIVLMYRKLQGGDYGMSSAYATLMFLILIVATVFNMKIQTADAEV